jgi:hypothetical protein
MTYPEWRSVLGAAPVLEPRARHHFEGVRRLGDQLLLPVAPQLQRVLAITQDAARLFEALARLGQRHLGVDPEGDPLLLVGEAVLHAPVLAPRSRHLQVQALLIRQAQTHLARRTDRVVALELGQSHGGTFFRGTENGEMCPQR